MLRPTNLGSRTWLGSMTRKLADFETFATAHLPGGTESLPGFVTMRMKVELARWMSMVGSRVIVVGWMEMPMLAGWMTTHFLEGTVMRFVSAIDPAHSVSWSVIILRIVLSTLSPIAHCPPAVSRIQMDP